MERIIITYQKRREDGGWSDTVSYGCNGKSDYFVCVRLHEENKIRLVTVNGRRYIDRREQVGRA